MGCITISIDGVENVNDIIRYPTDWNAYCLNIELLYNSFPNKIIFNNTEIVGEKMTNLSSGLYVLLTPLEREILVVFFNNKYLNLGKSLFSYNF